MTRPSLRTAPQSSHTGSHAQPLTAVRRPKFRTTTIGRFQRRHRSGARGDHVDVAGECASDKHCSSAAKAAQRMGTKWNFGLSFRSLITSVVTSASSVILRVIPAVLSVRRQRPEGVFDGLLQH